MLSPWFQSVSRNAARTAFAIGLGAWLVAATPAEALNDGTQLLSGGQSTTANSTRFTAPGVGGHYSADFAGGRGEEAAQIRMPAGVLRNLKVHVMTESIPASGSLRVRVRIDGANTVLTCQVAGTGDCAKNKAVNVPAGGRLAISSSNTFVGAGAIAYSFTLLFD